MYRPNIYGIGTSNQSVPESNVPPGSENSRWSACVPPSLAIRSQNGHLLSFGQKLEQNPGFFQVHLVNRLLVF